MAEFIFKQNKETRLDKFLLEKLPQFSRAFLKEQVKIGKILVNGKPAKASEILNENDKIEIPDELSEKKEQAILPNPKIKLNILFEDDDVIVLDKPAGIPVHPRFDKNGLPLQNEINNTLVSALLAHYPPLKEVGDQPAIRPGIVHRLDKDTSGIIIVAKNQKSFEFLKQQFQDRLAEKKYIALVAGHLKEKESEISQPLARSENDPSKQKISAQGKPAITQYKLLEKFKDFSLIEARPRTGRMHQIRVHFAWLGHPIAGDKKYGKAAIKGLNRQFLHAAQLQITLPASPLPGQKKTFLSPLPPDLEGIRAGLEKSL